MTTRRIVSRKCLRWANVVLKYKQEVIYTDDGPVTHKVPVEWGKRCIEWAPDLIKPPQRRGTREPYQFPIPKPYEFRSPRYKRIFRSEIEEIPHRSLGELSYKDDGHEIIATKYLAKSLESFIDAHKEADEGNCNKAFFNLLRGSNFYISASAHEKSIKDSAIRNKLRKAFDTANIGKKILHDKLNSTCGIPRFSRYGNKPREVVFSGYGKKK